MTKLPAFQFYPGDWMKDPALRACTVAARGLWTDMLCLMFESVRRGYLQHATGKPVTPEQLARMTGCSADEVSRLLQELDDSGVFSRTEHGVIYSRRMTRDEGRREKCREAGRLGGNPTLKGEVKGPVKGGVKGPPNRKPTPSSSASSSPSGGEVTPSGITSPAGVPATLNTPAFAEAWAEWEAHRKAKKATLTPQAVKQQFKFLSGIGEARAIAVIEYSIRQSYTGLIEESNGRPDDRPGGDDRRRGRAVAPPGKWDDRDTESWTPEPAVPAGPDLFSAAGHPADGGGSPPGAA